MSNVWLCFTCDEPAGVCECEGPPMRFTNRHLSDCAVHNEPAYPNGPCDCGVEKRRLAAIASLKRPQGDDMSEWQPIGPEQRDGTPILAGSTNHECREVVVWQDGLDSGALEDRDLCEGWVNVGPFKDRFYANPLFFTHFMPLPAAPKEPK